MALINTLLVFAHLLGLVLVSGAALALWRAGDLLAGGMRGEKGVAQLGARFRTYGIVGLALSWISGLILMFSKYDGLFAFGIWFWIKIAFVIGLSATLGIAGAAFKRAISTEATAAAKAHGVGGISVLLALAVLFSAAFAFG